MVGRTFILSSNENPQRWRRTYSPSASSDEPSQNSANDLSPEKKKRKKKKSKREPVEYGPPPDASEFPKWTPRDFFRYELIHQSSKSQARVGRIHTPHGTIETPGFVAVATNAALKGVDFRTADEAGLELCFANTYHLMISPGPDIIEAAGGIHKFTNRSKRASNLLEFLEKKTDAPPFAFLTFLIYSAIFYYPAFITDSGGFQVFSLAYGSVHEELSSKGELKKAHGNKHHNAMGKDAVKVTEDGATFRSYRDGSKFLLTPESTVQAQKKIGADIIIPLDELPGYYTDRKKLEESVNRTHRWEARSLKEHLKNIQQQAMYCVVHGGVDKELRTKSLEYLSSLPFDGFGIGGSLGNGREELQELLTWLMPMFEKGDRAQKPRHLLGIADEESIRNAVPWGLDTFDSCYPTRVGRHGTFMTRNGNILIKRGRHAREFGVKVDDQCTCPTCTHYDRAYLNHLFKVNEPVAVSYAAIHNIHYMNDLMKDLRRQILNDEI